MRLKDESGAVIAEFALVLPLLALLLFGMIEFGLVLFNKQVITNASREAARAGIVVDPDIPGGMTYDQWIQSIAANYCSNYLINLGATSSPTVASTYSATGFGNELRVEISYNYDFLIFGGLAQMFGAGTSNTVNLYARTVMRFE